MIIINEEDKKKCDLYDPVYRTNPNPTKEEIEAAEKLEREIMEKIKNRENK